MQRRKLLITGIIFVSLIACTSASAQADNKAAQKFDAFGDILYSDLIARLDNFAVVLMNDTSAKGFIVVYRTRRDLPGLNHAMAMRMKGYLVDSRGVPRDRLAVVDGGVADQFAQELWIVPPGTALTPRSDAKIGYVQNPNSAWKFYEQGFIPLSHYKRYKLPFDADAEVEALEAYANKVKTDPSQTAAIIVYAQYNRRPRMFDLEGNYDPLPELRIDPAGTARRQLNRYRDHLVREYGIAASKIKTIDGGYRKQRWVEFWIVPAGEAAPIPTPNSFPKRGRK